MNLQSNRVDGALIHGIVGRACEQGLVHPRNRLNLEISITACHLNGCLLDLQGLLDAGHEDFAHDVIGIDRHTSRETGKLTDLFSPRYTRRF